MNIFHLIGLIAICLISTAVFGEGHELLTLNSNPSFEVASGDFLEGWTWDGSRDLVSAVNDSPIGEYGSQCLQMDLSSVPREKCVLFLMSGMISIDPQKTYVQSGWLKNEGLMPDGFGTSMLRRFYDKDKKYIASANGSHNVVKNIGPTDWSWFSGKMVPDLTPGDEAKEDVEIPANAAYVQIGVLSYCYNRKTWVDGLRLEEYRAGMLPPAAGNDRIASAGQATGKMTIDANFNEDAWNGEWSGGFRQTVCPPNKVFNSKTNTSFRVLGDKSKVYIGIKCQRLPGVPLVNTTQKNGTVAVANDDCVELFIDPTGERQGFVHIMVNSLGFYCVEFNNRGVSVDLVSAAKTTDNEWDLELSLSREKLWQLFNEAGMSCDTKLWNFNLTRHQPGNPDDRYTSWSFTGEGGFHNVNSQGYLLWESPVDVLKEKLSIISQKMNSTRKTNQSLLSSADGRITEVAELKNKIAGLYAKAAGFNKIGSSNVSYSSFVRIMPEVSQLPAALSAEYTTLSRLSLSLPKSREAYGYMVYKTPLFERPSAQRIPQKQELIKSVGIRAAVNEITAGTFSIFSKESLSNVTITSSVFRNSQGKPLPKNSVDIRILEPFGKRTESDILATDLSIPFDGWLKDYAGKRRFIPAIAANQSRKLWVLINTKSVQPGTYAGIITIKPANKKETKIPVKFEVLPIKLPESDRLLGFFYSGVINPDPTNPPGGSNYMFYNGQTTVESCTAELKHMRSSGFNFVLLEAYAKGPFDLEYCRKMLTCAKNAGFKKVGLLGAEHIIVHGIAENEEQKLAIEAARKNFADRISKILPLMNEMGFKEYYIYGADEPHVADDIERNRIIAEEVHKFGGKVLVAFVFEDNTKTLKGIMDVPIMSWGSITSGPSPLRDALVKGQDTTFSKVCYYANLGATDTAVSRLTFGWYMYKSKFNGNIPWAYYYLHLNWKPFNVDDFPYDTAFYVYPTLDQPIPNLKYEAAREGVNDLRYLEYLDVLLQKCKNEKVANACRKKLNTMLSEISLTNDRGIQSSNFLMPPQRLDDFRANLQKMILTLQSAAVGTMK